ncbi:MAG: AAA family ATPase [Clostridiales bacterium]|nr:AAA family ATPase [Clostridiales bacterium]
MNIQKAKEDIKNTVRAYLDKDSHGEYMIPDLRQRPILLMGPPGIGKTQIMQQIAKECDIGLVAYTITHHTRQSAIGLPYIKEETFDGVSRSVTEYTMSEIIYSIYHYMEETGKKEGILFIDEINCVSETLAPTMLQFLQCKTFGNQEVPKGWIITAAGNPPEYNKSVRDFDFVTLDRVRKINIEADLEVFRSYARARHLHPFILSYLELRPQNFYRTENDVDGMQFVTARGWEDLSCLIYSYEKLSIPVDEDVIHQFLQHEDVAKDVAAYYDLYQKYQDDYDISRILTGEVKSGIFERLFRASFDERLSCVELLVSGLHTYIATAMAKDHLTTECYDILKKYRQTLKTLPESNANVCEQNIKTHSSPDCVNSSSHGDSGMHSACGIWKEMMQAREDTFTKAEKTGLISTEDKARYLDIVELLQKWTPDSSAMPKEAFSSVKTGFDQLCEQRSKDITLASTALENSFTFMEDAFGEGQEMVIFVTELTMDPDISAFITENGCERYFKYNKSLLIGSRRAAILQELNRDEIYLDARSYDF